MAAAVRFVLLLPGAEAKRPGGNPLAPDMFDYRASNTFNFFSELNPERRALIRAAQAQGAAGERLEELLGAGATDAAGAVAANSEVFDAPLMAAIERYGPGVMYRAMDFETLPTGAQRRLLENGVVVSGMFGLLRPDDLIPEYHLPIESVVDGIGDVADYWRDVVTPHLDKLVTDRIVWNLLPEAHERVWIDGGTYDRMFRLAFEVDEAGRRRPADSVAELAGSFVHYVVERVAESPEALADWDAPGGFEPATAAGELGEKGGTLTYVRFDDWPERRAARHAARAEELRPRTAPSEEADEDAA